MMDQEQCVPKGNCDSLCTDCQETPEQQARAKSGESTKS
jgi:hypothetical protein